MRAFLGAFALAAVLGAPPVLGEQPAITVLGATLLHETDSGAPRPDGVEQLAEAMRGRIFRHYVIHGGLEATPEEIAELAAYNAEFERRDRAQRARKLAELEARLRADGLSTQQRAHLEDFRATLARLAAYEADQDRKPRPAASETVKRFAPWIEMWKVHRVLYERYGGAVALAPFGHYPQGAWAALIMEYERRGELVFHDARLREHVLGLFNRPPRIPVAPQEVDFTPYWRRPIPPSYFPDATPAGAEPEARAD